MSYYFEGYDAYCNGVTRCPYARGTAGFTYWFRGWDTALLAALAYAA